MGGCLRRWKYRPADDRPAAPARPPPPGGL